MDLGDRSGLIHREFGSPGSWVSEGRLAHPGPGLAAAVVAGLPANLHRRVSRAGPGCRRGRFTRSTLPEAPGAADTRAMRSPQSPRRTTRRGAILALASLSLLGVAGPAGAAQMPGPPVFTSGALRQGIPAAEPGSRQRASVRADSADQFRSTFPARPRVSRTIWVDAMVKRLNGQTSRLPSRRARAGFGVDPHFRPAYDVLVPVGGLTQALIDAHPAGTRFALVAGTHRLSTTLAPKERQQFLGMPGAIVNGSRVLAGWVAEGGHWYVTGQTQRLPRIDPGAFQACQPDYPMCNNAEDVFVDDRLLRQVPQPADLGRGTYFFDYTNSRIYLGADPRGHKVETTLAARAFKNGFVGGVVLRNLVVEKFGNSLETGAVEGEGWIIQSCEMRLNHGVGAIGWGGAIRHNRFHDNGQAGSGGGGNGQLFEHNEVANNNTQHVNPNWSGHGIKWAYATNLTVRRNWVHHNIGSGMATDINNYAVVYEDNIVEDNEGPGIVHEIGYDAVIRNNVVRRNGMGAWTTWFTERVGISVVNSPNVAIYGNQLANNRGGGVLAVQNTRLGTASYPDPDGNVPTRGPWVLQNLDVHDNDTQLVGNAGSSFAGFDIHPDVPDRGSYVSTRNNRFYRNSYRVPTSGDSGRWFFYPDAGTGHQPLTWAAWRAVGYDAAGGFTTG